MNTTVLQKQFYHKVDSWNYQEQFRMAFNFYMIIVTGFYLTWYIKCNSFTFAFLVSFRSIYESWHVPCYYDTFIIQFLYAVICWLLWIKLNCFLEKNQSRFLPQLKKMFSKKKVHHKIDSGIRIYLSWYM